MEWYSALRPILFALPPEMAHRLSLFVLSTGLVGKYSATTYPALATHVAGLHFSNPIGLAAGFDKDAQAITPLLNLGFGCVEAGTVTPRAQPGNAAPRLFRLPEDKAVINRLGFPSRGVQPFVQHLKARSAAGVVGANIGCNKDTVNPVEDYVTLLEAVYDYADYVTVNISSPNTQGLRGLQAKEKLEELIQALHEKRAVLKNITGRQVPVFVKIAPDLTVKEKEGIAETAVLRKIDALIISNTTISRPDNLRGADKSEQGGLSGAPLSALSTHVLRQMRELTQGRVPLIGVGGISSGADAYAKIRAGASLVQLYTSLVYAGFGLVPRIQRELAECLKRDGFKNIAEAVGN